MASPATAQLLTKQVLEAHSPTRADVFSGYVAGVLDGFSWGDQDASEKGARLYCPPPKLPLSHGNLVEIVRRHVAARPQALDYPFAMIALYALQETFPCPK